MQIHRPAATVLALGLAFLSACAESPTLPERAPLETGDPVAVVLAAADTAGATAASGDSAATARGVRPERDRSWVLGELFRHSLRRIAAAEDRAAAEAVADRIRAMHQEARALLEAGDTAAAREKAVETERAVAAVVVRVLGPEVAPRVLHHVAHRIDRLAHAIHRAADEGKDVSRPRRVLKLAATFHERAREALAAGHPAEALRLGARAADILAHLTRD